MNTHSAKLVKWSVMWLGKNGYIVEKDFGTDFSGAVNAYMTLKLAKKKWATLRSKNVGFAPPAHITAHETESWEIVRKRGKAYKRKVVTETNMLHEYNLQGTFWCPYCCQLRKFVRAEDEVNMMCPVCETTTRDFNVRNYNPKATAISLHQRRAPSAKSKPVRRNSRRR